MEVIISNNILFKLSVVNSSDAALQPVLCLIIHRGREDLQISRIHTEPNYCTWHASGNCLMLCHQLHLQMICLQPITKLRTSKCKRKSEM